MKQFLIRGALWWLIGAMAAIYLDKNAMILTVIFMLLIACLQIMKNPKLSKLAILCFSCFIISCGYNMLHEMDRHSEIEEHEIQGEQFYRGTIRSLPEIDGDIVQFTFQLSDWDETVIVRLKLNQALEQKEVGLWRRGDVAKLKGVLEKPSAASNFGGFDYADFLKKKRIYWQLKIDGIDEAVIMPAKRSLFSMMSYIDLARKQIIEKISRIFPEKQTGWMKGILIGWKEDVNPEQYDRFSRLGITHILAISGLHVGVFTGTIVWLLRRLGCTRETIFYIILVVIPLYILLTGAAPSVVRAGLMAMAGFYAWKKGMLKHGLSLLCLTLWIMLIIHPDYLHDIGFQLSFAVTAGLLIGVPALTKKFSAFPAWIRNTLAVTIVSQLVSFPLTVYYFHQFSLLSWLANLLIVPIVSVFILPAGMAALTIAFFSETASSIFAAPINWANNIVFRISELLDKLYVFQISWPSPSPLWIALYYTILLYFIRIWQEAPNGKSESSGIPVPFQAEGKNHFSRFKIPAMLFFLFLIVYGYQPDYWKWPAKAQVQFIDVGQGDAAIVRTPTGKVILIDGGGRFSFADEEENWKLRKDPFEIGKDVLVPLLKQRGVHRIDLLVVSHADADHIGGLIEVLKRVHVKRILFNGTVKKSDEVKLFIEEALTRNIPITPVYRGIHHKIDRFSNIHFIYPLKREVLRNESNQNEHSVVFMLKLFHVQFLFTGDVEEGQEMEIIASMSDRLPSSYEFEQTSAEKDSILIMKAGHHGSKTSTSAAWLDFWKPEVTVISAGRNNVYGHPHPDVIGRLQKLGSHIYRTDLHGEIQFDIQKQNVIVRTKLEIED